MSTKSKSLNNASSKTNTLERLYWKYRPQSRNSMQQKWIHLWSLTHKLEYLWSLNQNWVHLRFLISLIAHFPRSKWQLLSSAISKYHSLLSYPSLSTRVIPMRCLQCSSWPSSTTQRDSNCISLDLRGKCSRVLFQQRKSQLNDMIYVRDIQCASA